MIQQWDDRYVHIEVPILFNDICSKKKALTPAVSGVTLPTLFNRE